MGTKSMNQLAVEVNDFCERKGWNKELILGNMVANLHSEITEAWEEIRNNHSVTEIYFSKDDKGIDKPEGVPIELADEIIRVLHICGHFGIDIDACIEQKMAYNETRSYRHGGKTA